MRALVFFMALALAGCALPAAPEVGQSLTQRAWVAWIEPAPAPELRARLLAYADHAERVYRARWRWGPVPVVGIVWHPGSRIDAKRLAYVRAGVVHLTWGGLLPGQSLVHELHHLAAGGLTHEHAGLSWRVADWLGHAVAAEFWGLP